MWNAAIKKRRPETSERRFGFVENRIVKKA
jgi:hypothetical protein